jgi:hypothetical protein
MTGWGWTTDGQVVPNNGAGGYASNFRNRSDLWATGPVDIMWDSGRAVWTSHDILVGVTADAIASYGQGILNIYDGSTNTGLTMPVYDWCGNSYASGVRAIAHFAVHANKWYLGSPITNAPTQTFSVVTSVTCVSGVLNVVNQTLTLPSGTAFSLS